MAEPGARVRGLKTSVRLGAIGVERAGRVRRLTGRVYAYTGPTGAFCHGTRVLISTNRGFVGRGPRARTPPPSYGRGVPRPPARQRHGGGYWRRRRPIGFARGDTRKFVASARAGNLHASEAVPASVGRILVTRAACLNAGSSVAVETPPLFRLAVVYAIGTLVYGVAVAVVEARCAPPVRLHPIVVGIHDAVYGII